MKTILVIEDRPEIRRLVRLTLRCGDYEVQEAADGRCGLQMVHAMAPDAVLLDVMMPGLLDGYQVCAQIKADPQTAQVPVIMLTARGQTADREMGRAAGADAYLVKPFSPLELIECLDRQLKSATALRH